MLASEIITLSRDILGGITSAVLSDAKALEFLNIAYPVRILDVLKYQVDRNSSMKFSKTDLVDSTSLSEGDNGYDGEYAFPADLVRPTRIELSYDGVEFVRSKIYDLNENDESEITNLDTTFTKQEPFVRFERNSYFIRPLPTATVTNGIRIWYETREGSLLTSSTPNFELSFHPLLAFDIAQFEMMRNPKLYSNSVVTRINIQKNIQEEKFKASYNDQMKRNFKVKPKILDLS